ncbi:hypothetical protein J5S49_13430 [Virgibacillus halodenitrificans]|uniref:hypothetical protein n=1 Tax=Virgibacillus halodenitrificans TaxID=1482 RepID=UPI001F272B93|nr:hypothetical protein [Virgibacillus halodenitrificans]MCG1029293.1 hypothetical protein [Virgibacillus halodenitrificans]
MEKVKVTREQAKAIEDLISTGQRIATINRLLDGEVFFNEFYKSLRKMKPKNIIKSLIDEIGYEVEPEYKENDWVINTHNGVTFQLKNQTEVDNYFEGISKLENIRHATPEEIKQEKERRWWSDHGRGVKEVKKGDIIYSYPTGITFVNNENSRHVTNFEGFRVVCFVENRLDVNTNE